MRRTRTVRGRGTGLAVIVVVLIAHAHAGAAPATGEAETSNTILRVSVGDTTASVGVDEAVARRASASRHARAAFTAGQAAASTIGALERSGSTDGDSGSDEATEGDLAIEGLVALTLVEAAATIDLDPSRVASSAGATLASVDLLDGLVRLEGLVSSTATEVNGSAAEATRSISLDGLQVFDVEGLLEALGTTVLAVSCEGIEAVGAALGLDASAACEQLAAALAALAAARDDLAAIDTDLAAIVAGFDRATVEADRATAAALSCDPLDAICIADALAILTAIATTYAIPLSDPTDLATTQAEVVAGLDELLAAFDDRDTIADAIDQAAAGTCDATLAALSDAEAGLSDEDPAEAAPVLAAAHAEVEAACGQLRSTVDAVAGAPVVTLDDVEIALSARATADEPTAGVTVSIGAVSVGFNDPVAVADLAEALEASDAIIEAIAEAVSSLLVDAPVPDIELFVVSTDQGQGDGDGWFADASLTLVQFTQPAGTLTVPDEPPFAVLGDGAEASVAAAGMLGMLGASPGALLAATVDAPAVVAGIVIFDAGATFTPASDDPADEDPNDGDPNDEDPGDGGSNGGGGGDGDLPVTGTGDPASMLAALLLVGAAVSRRLLSTR